MIAAAISVVLAVAQVVAARPAVPERPPVAAHEQPAHAGVRGVASWYRWHPGEAAAGPALRRALGPNWRGMTVRVCGKVSCTTVRLTDWCLCTRRVIDLDVRAFARLADPSRGLVMVSVR